MLAFSSGNDAAVMLFLCVMEDACGNNISVAGAGRKKPHSIPQDNTARAEMGKEII